MTDLEIAKDIKLQHISKIAEKLNLDPDDIEMYGKYKAKLPLAIINEEKVKKSNLVLVTAISPTPAYDGVVVVGFLISIPSLISKKPESIFNLPSLFTVK